MALMPALIAPEKHLHIPAKPRAVRPGDSTDMHACKRLHRQMGDQQANPGLVPIALAH